jgi:hypothetical protein
MRALGAECAILGQLVASPAGGYHTGVSRFAGISTAAVSAAAEPHMAHPFYEQTS